ncbi:hypothetical protein [Nocardia goodfellowii]|uniref:Uncharacterized protein n=1 Tax=Nocardia goodfellowii TaxID=882446 RepID=A0ABS4Q9E8_9NOCA|nr:hypothetical protein [Nocardia goodfellowii]MBP2187733.1 hypothetical protein [Nocardia goodfellowii]
MRAIAEELDRAPESGLDRVGAVEMKLTPIGAGDFHGSIEEIARAAADIGGQYFHVTDSLGARITADVYRRPARPRRRRRWFS